MFMRMDKEEGCCSFQGNNLCCCFFKYSNRSLPFFIPFPRRHTVILTNNREKSLEMCHLGKETGKMEENEKI